VVKTRLLTLGRAARKGALVPQRGGWLPPSEMVQHVGKGNLARLRLG